MTDSEKHEKVKDTGQSFDTNFDTNLINSRVIGLKACSWNVDILRHLSHELIPVLT